ncbi:hypothetical protein [Danxiaibacter flavus]|uniref:hypothetical protein n=1 Tax=Danxiaibacter flavus TaxID=3049108 RepID=UPI0034E0CB15
MSRSMMPGIYENYKTLFIHSSSVADDKVIADGDYGRSHLSRFFNHSQATTLLNILSQTIFIAR